MSKKASKPKRTPKLSASQSESPGSLSPDELAARRAQIDADAAERKKRKGHELLSEGARLLSQRRPGEAAEKLEQAAEMLPDNVDTAINLGGAYVMQHKYSKAVVVLERASELAPGNPMVWLNLAAAYLGRVEISGPQQQERAIHAYEQALRIDPSTPNANYNLGLVYKDRQDLPRARAHFYRALEVDPADADARHWLDRLVVLEQDAADAAAQASNTPPEPADGAGGADDGQPEA